MNKHPLVKEILFDLDQIVAKTTQVALEISDYYSKKGINDVLCLGLLKGCIPFMAEFIKHLGIDCQTDYMLVSSYYGGVRTTGAPQIKLDLGRPVKGEHILIVEDIVDSGRTLKLVKEYLLLKEAVSVRIVTLLDKKEGRTTDFKPDWYCFDVKNAFLIGFGLDYEERLRNLPYIAEADVDMIKKWAWNCKGSEKNK